MGSPLAPVLANLFLGFHENDWINSFEGFKPLYYKRYVDDIIAVFEHETQADDFLSHLNSRHPNIKFTIEYEKDQKLPFLDVLLDRSNGNLITSVYRKATFSGVLTNFLSFTPMGYKLGLVKCLIDRVYKINNSSTIFYQNLEVVFDFLKRNLFPKKILDEITRSYLDSKTVTQPVDIENDSSKTIYFKLPYLGKNSILLKSKLKKLCEKFKITSKIKLAFQSFKICDLLSPKDKHSLTSHVIYKFECGFCKECYVGYTTRHYSTRIKEHLSLDKASHIFKHLDKNKSCKDLCDESNFSIIDRANTEYKLRIKEAIHIQWVNPIINRQKKSFKINLIF